MGSGIFLVLGVANDVTSGSANSFVISGKYFLRASVTDTPFHSNAESLLEVFAGNSINYYIIQRISSYGGFQDFYIRCSLNNGQSWSDWVEFVGNMPTFYKNYATLTALSEAVCGVKSDGIIFIGNINTITKNSICRVKATEASGDLLTQWVDWFTLVTLVCENLCGIQIAFRSSNDIVFRIRWDSVWQSTWYRLSADAN